MSSLIKYLILFSLLCFTSVDADSIQSNHIKIKSLTLTRPQTYIQKDYAYGWIQVPIKVMATYENGQSEEVTDIVTWHRKDKKKIKCFSSAICLLRYKDGTVWASLDGVTTNTLYIKVNNEIETKKKTGFKLIVPSLQERKGAIRGVSIQFSVVSDKKDLKYELINPPKGMKIYEHHAIGGCMSTFAKYESYATDGVIVQWDVPIDAIEGKMYNITMKATDIEGKSKELNFNIKVPKTKPIPTKLVNNELIVTDKSSPLYGMKMKGHSGEDISKMRLRSVAYGDVWKHFGKPLNSHKDIRHTVFVVDNMPKTTDIKFPPYMDIFEKRINLGAGFDWYSSNCLYDSDCWDWNHGSSYLYDNTNGVSFTNKYKSTVNSSEVFIFTINENL